MTMNAAMRADTVGLVFYSLLEHLDEAQFLARKCAPWSDEDAASARTLIDGLVTTIRGLVVLHGEPDDPGAPRCGWCETEWPCPTLITIHGLIKDPNGEFVKLMRARRI